MCTVLYIAHSQERSQVVRDILERFPTLEPIFYTADGLEALTLINLFKPDVVFLDALLEKVSGAEVARTLALAHKTLKIVVIEESLNPLDLLTVLDEIAV